jgi:hypothetical protein
MAPRCELMIAVVIAPWVAGGSFVIMVVTPRAW